MSDPRRLIPPVGTLVDSPAFLPLVERAGRGRVTEVLRGVQDEIRARLDADGPTAAGEEAVPEDPGWYAARVEAALDRADRPSLLPVINATGVVLHTNLGRAPLAEAARRAVERAAGYGSLEYDLESGTRGSRHDHCVGLLRELTGAPGALIVNNNAAAVLLALNTLARGREAVISRGELVEIGGSFRVPEIMAASGARMREVGATNRTHLRDYRDALGPETGLLLKVHRSNFRLEGFTAEVEAGELAGLAREAGVPLVHDLGSGALLDLTPLGLPPEPTAGDALAAGAGVVSMSGDKLLGGPQAGILLGDAGLVARMRRNPLARTVRPDKLTLAALEATLALYRDPDRAMRDVPTLRMLGTPAPELERRAGDLARRLAEAGVACATEDATSAVGGGSYPGVALPTTVVAVEPGPGGADALAHRLRTADPAVVGRVREGRVLLDPRTIGVEEEALLVTAVARAVAAKAVG